MIHSSWCVAEKRLRGVPLFLAYFNLRRREELLCYANKSRAAVELENVVGSIHFSGDFLLLAEYNEWAVSLSLWPLGWTLPSPVKLLKIIALPILIYRVVAWTWWVVPDLPSIHHFRCPVGVTYLCQVCTSSLKMATSPWCTLQWRGRRTTRTAQWIYEWLY